MNKQTEALKLALEGKAVVEQVHAYISANDTDFTSESMAAMVRDFIAAEREACAKVADEADKYNRHISREIANAIRARGNT